MHGLTIILSFTLCLSQSSSATEAFERKLRDQDRIETRAKKGDAKAIRKAIEAGVGLVGLPSAEHTFALGRIFKAQPLLTIKTARKLYGNNDNCLLRFLVPASGEVSSQDVQKVIAQIKVKDKTVTGFQQSMNTYLQLLSTNQTPDFRGCRLR